MKKEFAFFYVFNLAYVENVGRMISMPKNILVYCTSD